MHLAVLTELPKVINESIEVEEHPDYKKINGKRKIENGVDDPNLLVHRMYSAVDIDGKTYRVKTTMHEHYTNGNTPHDYRVTKIELPISGSSTSNALDNSNGVGTPSNENSTYPAAKLLKDVEKAYDIGKNILEESKKRDEEPLFSVANRNQAIFVSNAERAVDVTPEMKASVMEGQTMFSVSGVVSQNGEIDNDRLNEVIQQVQSGQGSVSRIPSSLRQENESVPAIAAQAIAQSLNTQYNETRQTNDGRREAGMVGEVELDDNRGTQRPLQENGRPKSRELQQTTEADTRRSDTEHGGTLWAKTREAIKQWAKHSGYWYDEARLTQDATDFDTGSESRVLLTDDGNKVRKLTEATLHTDGFNEGSVQELIESTEMFGKIFDDTAETIVGFGENEDGTLCIVTEQPYMKGEKLGDAIPNETERDKVLDKFMFDRGGFLPSGTNRYSNQDYTIHDVNKKNVIVGDDGILRVIDAVVTPTNASAVSGDVLFSVVTPAQDAAYMDAVQSGDMETAQRMVNEAARNPDIRFSISPNDSEMEAVKREAQANGTFMKAPNGKPTKLTERQWLQVRTEAFKNWFGDWENDPQNASKVVDENGEPMVVYHRTDNKFTAFDKSKLGETSGWPTGYFGFYFSNANEKGAYGKHSMPVFINIRDPYEITVDHYADFDYNYKRTDPETFAGHDGIRIKVERTLIDEKATEHYVAFDPTQIKSATENNGDFDPNNPDIRYSFIGRQGAQRLDLADRAMNRLNNLHTARQMEEQGKDAKTIKMATGWERGKDGKWRYEIPEANIDEMFRFLAVVSKSKDTSFVFQKKSLRGDPSQINQQKNMKGTGIVCIFAVSKQNA